MAIHFVSEEEFQRLEDAIAADRARLAELMPDVGDALARAQEAYRRLENLGWRDATYAPKDGTTFSSITWGSTGVHDCLYLGDWPDGGWWIAEAGDLWPARPNLFKVGSAPPPSVEPSRDIETDPLSGRSLGDTAWKRSSEEQPTYDGWGERYLLTWCTRTATYDIGCINGDWGVGEKVERRDGELWRWLDVNPERHLSNEAPQATNLQNMQTAPETQVTNPEVERLREDLAALLSATDHRTPIDVLHRAQERARARLAQQGGKTCP